MQREAVTQTGWFSASPPNEPVDRIAQNHKDKMTAIELKLARERVAFSEICGEISPKVDNLGNVLVDVSKS